jgi:hypothetical protein
MRGELGAIPFAARRLIYHRFISTLNEAGFLKEGEITFPHKQSAYVKLSRENFQAPAL